MDQARSNSATTQNTGHGWIVTLDEPPVFWVARKWESNFANIAGIAITLLIAIVLFN